MEAADYRNGRTGKETLAFAKNKANKLVKDNQLIRLFADEDFAFYLVRIAGEVYIGSMANGSDKKMPKFFTNKMVYDYGKDFMTVQRLFRP
jgi:hypothetical protein